MHIKKGDNIIVITGKDKGKTGKVIRVFRVRHRAVVEGVNLTKRRIRPRRAGEKGQIVDVALPLQASNIMLFCDHCRRGVRSKFQFNKDKKIKVCVRCGKAL